MREFGGVANMEALLLEEVALSTLIDTVYNRITGKDRRESPHTHTWEYIG
jgi:hypothetical protein